MASHQFRSMEEADDLVEASSDYSLSWQRFARYRFVLHVLLFAECNIYVLCFAIYRRLPLEGKQRLKAALMNYAISLLPQYEPIRQDLKDKARLFEKRYEFLYSHKLALLHISNFVVEGNFTVAKIFFLRGLQPTHFPSRN